MFSTYMCQFSDQYDFLFLSYVDTRTSGVAKINILRYGALKFWYLYIFNHTFLSENHLFKTLKLKNNNLDTFWDHFGVNTFTIIVLLIFNENCLNIAISNKIDQKLQSFWPKHI